MKKMILLVASLMLCSLPSAHAAGDYRGDEKCPLPKDWSMFSEPYEPLDHMNDYPVFPKADWPGWSCSYQREDGVIVQFGDIRSPQQQWRSIWGIHK